MPQLRVRRPGRRGSRGQSLVELALVLPLVLIILAAALDLGRLFAGWVSLTNATRIAANFAATSPNGPFTVGSTYDVTIRNEATTMNCTLPAIPQPTFSPDKNVGSSATVELSCTFRLITPILGSVVGNQVTMAAKAVFPVRTGQIPGVPVPPPTPCANLVVPNLVGLTVAQARAAWSAALFTGVFIPANGHNNEIVTGQAPDVGTCSTAVQAVRVWY